MAVIGSWGPVVFSVSRQEIKTFSQLKWDASANYAVHKRHLQEALLEFNGTDAEGLSFTMSFSAFLGVNPMEEVAKLLVAMRQGEVNRLVIGTKAYGRNKWVITKLSSTLEKYDNRGNLLVAKVNVTMKSYALR